MATGAAGDGLFWSMYEGCISGYDNCIQRRPYHRNCGCELHNKSRQHCSHNLPKSNTISYPIRRAWSEGNLVLAMANSPHSSTSSFPSPPPPAPRPPQPSPSLPNLHHQN